MPHFQQNIKGLSLTFSISHIGAYNKHQEVQTTDLDGRLRSAISLIDRIKNKFRVYHRMKQEATDAQQRLADKVEIAIRLDSELVEQIQHLTNDPSKVIEVAIRQWLRGETPRDDELTRTPTRKPLPSRGEWND
jgi:hypothetical protein